MPVELRSPKSRHHTSIAELLLQMMWGVLLLLLLGKLRWRLLQVVRRASLVTLTR